MFASETLATLVLLLGLSIVTRETSLFLLTLALLVAAVLSRVWERYCLVRVEYRRHFARTRVPFGEDVQLEVEVVNRKFLPLSWMETEDEFPEELPVAPGKAAPCHKPRRVYLAGLMAFRPYERVRRRYTLRCLARGEHLFGPVRLRSGDLFGFVSCERSADIQDSIVVYPRVVPLTQLGLPARNPLGDLRTRSWLFEDPSRLAGAREYRPGDSLRRIHWPASARTQQLHSRIYEATTTPKLAVFLNLTTGEHGWWGYDYDPDLLEMAITAAASVGKWGLDEGCQVGVYTNGLHRLGRGSVIVPPGRDAGQLERILVALGRLQPVAAKPFEELLAGESGRMPYGVTLVIVTPVLGERLAARLFTLRARGYGLVVLHVSRDATVSSVDGIAVHHVGRPEAWREVAVLDLASRQGA